MVVRFVDIGVYQYLNLNGLFTMNNVCYEQ